METYKGKINEFIDWTSGVNEVTGSKIPEVNELNPISGKSIRELILNKLKIPFVTYKDDAAGYIRFFSSNEAKLLWELYSKLDPEKAEELVLYNMDLPATYKITGLDSFVAARYIIEGNSLSPNAQLDITLGIEDSLGSPDSDVMTVSYQVVDNTGNTRYKSSDLIETGKNVVKLIYLYLRSGENKVTISVSANNHNAKTTRLFSIFLVTFSIDTNFSGYYSPIANNVPFLFDIFINRSITNLPVTTTVTIDGVTAKLSDSNRSNAIWRYAENSANPTKRMEIYNSYAPSTYELRRKHIMKIEARMEDPETGTAFPSNVLTYEFEVSPAEDDLTHTYINISSSISNSNYNEVSITDTDGLMRIFPIILATQYLATTINWGYNTDSFSQLLQTNVEWAIRTGSENYSYIPVATILGIKNVKPESLTFIPSESLIFGEDYSYLVARIDINGVKTDVAMYPLLVEPSMMNISEYGNYSLKLSAYGKTNTSSTKNQWIDTENEIYTTFSPGVTFDDTNGWNNNSLILKGTNSYAIIDYCPFPSTYNGTQYSIASKGATFEVDFRPEYIANEGDILITIGDPTKQHIEITTNTAGYYTGSTAVVKTNYKSGERIKLAFIFNKDSELSNDSGLVYIVNNGILERAAARGTAFLTDDSGKIRIGGTNSSVRVFMIRAYRLDLSPKQCLDNYMFDNASNIDLISRNDVYKNSSEITYDGMSGKLDIIIIEGDLTNILSNKDAKENATVNIKRESNSNPENNFTIENCRIRNHGQSTLSYPITSIKAWFNKSNKFDEETGLIEIIPTFNCLQQAYLGLNKNRYVMKSGAIPSNKFVLQANYADSSGTHNGSLLRLINSTWYNALFGEDKLFKLRTSPLLFASGAKITHNNISLNEDGSWVDGVYNISSSSTGYTPSYVGKTWPEITGKDFPYQIRVSADSFPCVVFYRDTSTGSQDLKLLGLYVFMDDKKSDFIYGERSIYNTDDLSDPFCLKIENSKKDKAANKVWDNEKVLLIEVVYPNSPLTSYISKTVASSYTLDENDNLIPDENAILTRFDEVTARDSNGKPIEFQWEQHFELIYPDKEDITDKNNNFDPDKFAAIVQPFEDFLEWITDVAALRNTGSKLGNTGAKSYVTQAELDKFTEEAHDHLDLYKLAAYYVFFLRFGLVDSVERNAQVKTYDGLHWHYEPWDMDIALGNANNGVIAYDPPITRDSRTGGSGYVFAGRTTRQSNVLWDCLEAWDYWANVIVPEVAQALYDAGLTYENAIKMFDEEYVNKWSETLYNESGHYKYIDATSITKYRLYLNGARTSHRHWWLSKSMNYYDAKWSCGDFTKNNIVLRIGKLADIAGKNVVKIYPTSNTFFKMVYGAEGNRVPLGNGLVEAGINPGEEAQIDVALQLEDKQPCLIFGATSILRLDLSGLLDSTSAVIGAGYTDINFGGAYDSVLGAQIKELNLGAPCTPSIYTNPNSSIYESNLTVGQNDIAGVSDDGHDALENLETLDVIGWYTKKNLQAGGWLSNLLSENGHDRKNISTLYAMGCNMATEFTTSITGNNFKDLRLPDSIRTLTFTNSSWESLSFWSTTEINSTRARYNKVGIPTTINSISFKGSTGKNECSLKLVLDWIDAIDNSLPYGHTEEDLYEALGNKTLVVDLADWGRGNIKITYTDILRFAHFGGDGSLHPIKGYAVMQPDSSGMNSAKITLLQTLFGENVFNIGTTNANLVVDYLNNEIIIGISGIEELLLLDGENIWLKEPNSAKLNANHFTLTAGSNDNLIADNGENDPSKTNNLSDNKYIWGFVSSKNVSLGPMSAALPYARLERGNDGIIRLRTSEGSGNDYIAYIRVVYGKTEGSSKIAVWDTIAVNIKGVTYPSDYVWSVSGTGVIDKFNYTESIARQLFGNTIYNSIGNNSDIYILRSVGLQIEFSLNPAEEKYYYDNSGRQYENWTANADNLIISYYISERGNSLLTSSNSFTSYMDKDVFSTNAGEIIEIGSGTYVNVPDNATHGGIPIKVATTLPNDPIIFLVNGRAKIGGKDPITKSIFFIVINDNDIIIPGSTLALSLIMWNKYCDLYNLQAGAPLDMYRTHLLSIYGEVDFSTNPDITSLVTETRQSVFKYLLNITSIKFNGNTAITLLEDGNILGEDKRIFNFDNIKTLNTLIIKNNPNIIGTLDLSQYKTITSVDLSGTPLGIKLPTGSPINNLVLGSPSEVSIIRPKVLTDLTIENSVNLTDIELIDINIGDVANYIPATSRSYNMFDTLVT